MKTNKIFLFFTLVCLSVTECRWFGNLKLGLLPFFSLNWVSNLPHDIYYQNKNEQRESETYVYLNPTGITDKIADLLNKFSIDSLPAGYLVCEVVARSSEITQDNTYYERDIVIVREKDLEVAPKIFKARIDSSADADHLFVNGPKYMIRKKNIVFTLSSHYRQLFRRWNETSVGMVLATSSALLSLSLNSSEYPIIKSLLNVAALSSLIGSLYSATKFNRLLKS